MIHVKSTLKSEIRYLERYLQKENNPLIQNDIDAQIAEHNYAISLLEEPLKKKRITNMEREIKYLQERLEDIQELVRDFDKTIEKKKDKNRDISGLESMQNIFLEEGDILNNTLVMLTKLN